MQQPLELDLSCSSTMVQAPEKMASITHVTKNSKKNLNTRMKEKKISLNKLVRIRHQPASDLDGTMQKCDYPLLNWGIN
jgi:hypothetical protein